MSPAAAGAAVNSRTSASGTTRSSTCRSGVGQGYAKLRSGAATGKNLLRRRPSKGALGLLAGLLVVLLVLAYLFFLSPLLTFTTARIVGGDRFGQTQLQPLIADELGRPMAAVSLSGLEAEVGANPRIASVHVVRAWPHTIEFRVSERVPVMAVPTSASKSIYRLLAGDGKTVEQVMAVPAGVAEATVATSQVGGSAVTAAAAVLASLPAELRSKVTGVSAATRDSVTLALTVPAVASISVDSTGKVKLDQPKPDKSGKVPERDVTVVWGGVEQSALKAEVLVSMLTTDALVYDVSSPSTPVTRDSAMALPSAPAGPEPGSEATASPSVSPNASAAAGDPNATASSSISPSVTASPSPTPTAEPTLGSAVQVP